MKQIARQYFNEGHNIVTVRVDSKGKKIALDKWKKWQSQRQTLEEFEGLRWNEADGFAVVCGRKIDNGLYVGIVDIDVKHASPEAIERGEKFRESLRTTQTEQTPSKGWHYIYYSKTAVGSVNQPKITEFCGCELLGEGHICIMAPSLNKQYKRMNDNTPTIVESLSDLFYSTLQSIGYKLKKPKSMHASHGKTQPPTKIRPCFYELMKREKLIHLQKVALVVEHHSSGVSFDDIVSLFVEHNSWEQPPSDFNLKKTRKQIQHIIDNKYKRFLCTTLEANDVCLGLETCEFTDIKKDWFYINDKGKEVLSPIKFAKWLLETYYFKTMRDNEALYVYDWNTGIYDPLGEVFVKEQIVRELDEKTKQQYLKEILFFVRGMTYFNRIHNPLGSVVVDNGILDVTTRELTPYTPEQFIVTALPLTYDEKKDCPKIKKFLSEVVTKEQMPIIQEFIGYCLHKGMPFHKALMLVGDGANGKSTLLELIKLFLGPDNVSSATLQSLCHNRFSTAQLYGKLGNICADLPDAALKQTGMFKMLVGNDTVTGEEKFKQGFPFKNHAKLMFSTNKIPETKDDTTAFFRRWVLIACNSMFLGDGCNPHMLEEITTDEELSGLLNFALDGLKRILKQGHFSTSENIEDLRKQYIRKSNSAKAYIEEFLAFEEDEGPKIVEADLYAKYIMFCRTNHLPTMKKRFFTQNMHEHLPQAKQTNARMGPKKKVVHVWQFVKFVATVAGSSFKHKSMLNINTLFDTNKILPNGSEKSTEKKCSEKEGEN